MTVYIAINNAHLKKISHMTLDQARQEAANIAKLILAGEIDEYNGAMKIWKEILDKLDEKIPEDLWIFKSNASAIEDYLCNP